MREIKLKAWHIPEKKLYFRAYQKLTHVLLCDPAPNQDPAADKGIPVKRASFEDCFLLESTDLQDVHGVEIFESDIVRIKTSEKEFEGVVGSIPDMYRSRKLHPLHDLLELHQVDAAQIVSIQIIGNQFAAKG